MEGEGVFEFERCNLRCFLGILEAAENADMELEEVGE